MELNESQTKYLLSVKEKLSHFGVPKDKIEAVIAETGFMKALTDCWEVQLHYACETAAIEILVSAALHGIDDEYNSPKVFRIPGYQEDLLKKFMKKHRKCGVGTAADQYSYTFIPTSLGMAIYVKCGCGCELMLGDFLDDIREYREIEPKLKDVDSFEKAAYAILSKKQVSFRRLAFRAGDYPFEQVYTYAVGIAYMADSRIGESILWKVQQDKNGCWIPTYNGTDEENLELFMDYFEKHIKQEVKKYDCKNEKLLELLNGGQE